VKTVVLGGGFIGSAIARTFADAGHEVELWVRTAGPSSSGLATWALPCEAGPRGPMPIEEPLTRRIHTLRPDLFVLAAGIASVGDSLAHPGKVFEETVTLASRTLHAASVGHPSCRYVTISSAAVYGNPAVLPVPEDAPIAPISPYGQAKAMAEQAVRSYAEGRRLRTLILRPFSVYGEGQRKLVVAELTQQLLEPGRDTLTLQGTGEETRDYLHIDDLARAVLHLAGLPEFPVGPLNLASGTSTSIRDMAALLQKAAGTSLPLRTRGEPRPGNPDHWQADVRRLRSLGFSPAIPLAEGLRRCFDWMAAGRRPEAPARP